MVRPLVEEVKLIESNPGYVYVRHRNGRESTVPLRHLPPCGESTVNQHHVPPADKNENSETAAEPAFHSTVIDETPPLQLELSNQLTVQEPRREPVLEQSKP